MKNKTCTKCGEERPLPEFYKNNNYKDGHRSWCKECCKEYQKKWKKTNKNYFTSYLKRHPWKRVHNLIKQRCENIKTSNYKYYGGRGIKALITGEELKELWFRDKAYTLDRPSIDRIDNDGNYCYDNCQFIEFVENSAKDKRISILQHGLEGNFIKEWESAREVDRQLGINEGNIGKCLKNKRKSAGGFKWYLKKFLFC